MPSYIERVYSDLPSYSPDELEPCLSQLQDQADEWRMVWPIFPRANALGADCDYTAVAYRMPPNFNPTAFPLAEPMHPFGKERTGK